MPVPTGAVESYQQIGIREDLSNVIFDISPTATPFQSMSMRGSATQTQHEYQTDDLDSAAFNALIEGDTAPDPTFIATVKLLSRTQISGKTVIVSGTADALVAAGRKNETGLQIAKKGKELKRDMEKILTSNQASDGGSSGAPRKLAGLETWYPDAGNINEASDATSVGWAAGDTTARTPGTKRALTESMLKQVVRDAWNVGGEPDYIMCGPFNKQVISTFTGNATRTDRSEDRKLTAALDVYGSDFGDLKITPNRFQQDRTVFVLDLSLWSVDYLRPFRQKPLAEDGDTASRRLLIVEYTLKSCQVKGSGAIFDVNDS